MADSLDRRTASRIIHSLVESGQPPKQGAKLLNVGTEAFIRRLRSDYLEDLLTAFEGQDGSGACKWVEANYGNGKTQSSAACKKKLGTLITLLRSLNCRRTNVPWIDPIESMGRWLAPFKLSH